MTNKPKMLNSLFWSFLDLISRQGLLFLVQIILTRILLPEHFGLIGMTAIFIAIATTLTNSGMDQALIREKEISRYDYSVVFTFNLIISIIIYLIFYVISPVISIFYGEPEITVILRVLMLIVIINSFSLIQRVILVRDMEFKKQTLVSVISTIVSGTVAIYLALAGIGVWSLVIQQLLFKTIETILFIFLNKQIFSLKFNMKTLRKYFKFGFRLTVSGLISNTFSNIYFVIIGRMHSIDSLGYYTNASKLRDSISQSFTSAIQKVTYPVLSKKRENLEILSRDYEKLIRMTAFLFFPIMVGFSAIAPTFIPFLLGDRWNSVIPYFQLLCIAGMLYPIHALNLNILKVLNKSELFLKIELIKIGFISTFIIIALYIDGSINSLITASIFGTISSLGVNIFYSSKLINYPFLKQLKNLLPITFVSFIMFYVVTKISLYLDYISIVNLAIQVILGVFIYILLNSIFKSKELHLVFNMIQKFVKRKV